MISSFKKINYKSNIKPWLVCLTAAQFFLFEFIQINMFNSIDPYILKEFHLKATELGLLSACYFYSTVGFLLPAGQILDRFSPKVVMLSTLGICIFGIIGFSMSHTFILAAVFRFLEGIGSAFCFLGSFRIASRWFPPERMAFVTGVIVTIGMMGGVIAQTPLTVLVESVGWRPALLLDALFGILLTILIFKIVQDYPSSAHNENKLNKSVAYFHGLRLVYFSLHNWCCGIYTCLLNLPIALLGALWGSLYLEQALHFSRNQASIILTMVFLGTILGSPIVGYISDYLDKKKLPMLVCILFSISVSLLIINIPNISYWNAIILFFLLGFFSSAQILGYPIAAKINDQNLSGMSASIVSFTTMSGYIVFQPLFGWIMDINGYPLIVNGQPIYTLQNYQAALFLIPASLIIALVATLLIKTNYKNT